jgi:hypothetical protein
MLRVVSLIASASEGVAALGLTRHQVGRLHVNRETMMTSKTRRSHPSLQNAGQWII